MKRAFLLLALVPALACQTRLDVPSNARISCADSSACPEDWRCDQVNSRCVPNDAPAATCGDGILDAGEACDCGDAPDAYPATCIGANSDTEPNRCRTTCVWFTCGDSAIDSEETCDDGNTVAGDGCNASCERELCGNGVQDQGEVCDDGNTVDGDECSGDCRSLEICGNLIVDRPVGEQCDDGNTIAGDGCNGCLLEYCGNGTTDPGEVCDDGLRCVDGTPCTDDPTQCANCLPRSGDGCSNDCLSNETCRNSYVDSDSSLTRPEQCDDGDEVSHDGCSSDCMLELPQWSELGTRGSSLADGRTYPAMAYDARRGRFVLFGGWYEEVLDDTWELEGNQWRRITTTSTPPARRQHQMVYDQARRRMVMFGGRVVTDRFDDTWEYDGDWHQVSPTVSPGARNNFAMTYDPVRGRTVIFGGSEGTFLDETWEYDGVTWERINTAASPDARILSAMAYNPIDSRIVLFGGDDGGGTLFGDTWEYDGSNWSLVSSTGPSARSKHTMVYSAARNAVVLYGGYISGDQYDTWEWNGSAWSAAASSTTQGSRSQHAAAYVPVLGAMVVFGGWRTPSTYIGDTLTYDASGSWNAMSIDWVPYPRVHHAMAFDIGRSRAVLFGGDCDPTSGVCDVWMGDTWEHDGSGWLAASPTTSPSPERRYHALAYDSKRGVTVLFGGEGQGTVSDLSDTWEYDGNTWVETTPGASPPGREFHSMVYDTVRERVVLFGGTHGAVPLDDTWEYDGGATPPTWTPITGTSPSARERAALAFDAARGVTVLFGGRDDTSEHGDTWEYRSDATWHLVSSSGPSARYSAGLAFYGARGRLVLHGGTSGSVPVNGTWEFDGSGWTEVVLAGLPPVARSGSVLMADPRRRGLMMFGGWSALLGGRLDEVWTYQYRSVAPEEQCTNGSDDDTDTLADCDDPDCASQIVCVTPCADGTVEQTFAGGMVGCAGSVTFAERRSLCAAGIRVCSAFDWLALRDTPPTHNYWVEDNLNRVGTGTGDCAASSIGFSCASPMRICAASTDAEGNTCDWIDCGFASHAPNEYFGGCAAATAGSLCCAW